MENLNNNFWTEKKQEIFPLLSVDKNEKKTINLVNYSF